MRHHRHNPHNSTVGCRRTGVHSHSLNRSCFSRLHPISFLFFDLSSSHIAGSAYKVLNIDVARAHNASRAGEAAEMFRPVDVESFRSQQCRWRSRLRSKRCLCVVKPFLNQFSSLGLFLFLRCLCVVKPFLRPAGGVNHPDSVLAKVRKLAAKKALRWLEGSILSNSRTFQGCALWFSCSTGAKCAENTHFPLASN